MSEIVFTVTSDAIQKRLWVRIYNANDPVPLTVKNGVAKMGLPAGEHDFFWSIAGKSGQKIAIIGKQGADTILTTGGAIKEGKVAALAAKHFTVK